MRNYFRRLLLLGICVALSISHVGLFAHTVRGADQEQNPPVLQITGIDTANFPEIKVTLYGENLGVNLADLPVTLREDKESRNVQKREISPVGIQTAFVLDASNNIRDPGNIDGRPRYEEFRLAVDKFVDKNILSAQTDWTAAFTTGPAKDNFRQLSEWTQDHGAMRNTLLDYQPKDNTPNTPLFDLVDFVLNHFENSKIAPNVMKSMVIFSNGFDATSDLDRKDVIGRASRMNIRIYTVMVGPESPERKTNLERIAKLTGGAYVLLNSLDDLNSIWSALERQRLQLSITYPLGKAQPKELEITAAIPNQPPLVRRADFPVVPAKPVQIEVAAPQPNEVITRKAPAPDTPLAEIEPKLLPIQLHFAWPDGHQRRLQRIEYIINDETKVQDTEPFGQFAFPIADLPAGKYTLRVRVLDEFGLQGQSEPLPLQIQVNVPPPPPPTVTLVPTATPAPTEPPAPTLVAEPTLAPTPTVTEDSSARSGTLLRFLLLMLLLIGLIAFLVYRRLHKRNEHSDMSDSASVYNLRPTDEWSEITQKRGVTDDATEIPAAPPFTPVPIAYLVALEPKDHLPARIILYQGQKIRIGRRADLSDIVLDDKQISRAHATITSKDNGFHIQDDGSTGGTFVNQRKLGPSDDRLLAPGDVINLYAIAYRFELADEHTEIPAESPFEPTSPLPQVNGTPLTKRVVDEPTEYVEYSEHDAE
ncbi:MAG: FHA domain-containing protein [Caldilineaceae bacterium]